MPLPFSAAEGMHRRKKNDAEGIKMSQILHLRPTSCKIGPSSSVELQSSIFFYFAGMDGEKVTARSFIVGKRLETLELQLFFQGDAVFVLHFSI